EGSSAAGPQPTGTTAAYQPGTPQSGGSGQVTEGTRTGWFDTDASPSDVHDGTGRERIPYYRLEVGHCVESLPLGGASPWTYLIVDCDLPHKAEVYATFDLTEGDWPGDDAVDEEAYEDFQERLLNHPGAPDDPSVLVGTLYPTEGAWAIGDRRVVCLAYYFGDPRTGSLSD